MGMRWNGKESDVETALGVAILLGGFSVFWFSVGVLVGWAVL